MKWVFCTALFKGGNVLKFLYQFPKKNIPLLGSLMSCEPFGGSSWSTALSEFGYGARGCRHTLPSTARGGGVPSNQAPPSPPPTILECLFVLSQDIPRFEMSSICKHKCRFNHFFCGRGNGAGYPPFSAQGPQQQEKLQSKSLR